MTSDTVVETLKKCAELRRVGKMRKRKLGEEERKRGREKRKTVEKKNAGERKRTRERERKRKCMFQCATPIHSI